MVDQAFERTAQSAPHYEPRLGERGQELGWKVHGPQSPEYDIWPPDYYTTPDEARLAVAQAQFNAHRSQLSESAEHDAVNHPKHYTSHPSGIECIDITRHMGFNLGNAFKYIWRADLKHDDGGVEDLEKALWYIKDEIEKRKRAA